ncbi:hypothetical protein Tco_1469681 [Tanacetum coccineum]
MLHQPLSWYPQLPNTGPMLEIVNERYEDMEREKMRNRFPLAVLREVDPQNYQFDSPHKLLSLLSVHRDVGATKKCSACGQKLIEEHPLPKCKDHGPHTAEIYRLMFGSLMYLTASKPDIMFAISACSRHQVTLLTSHLNAVKKIFKYLKGQPKLDLWYPKDSPFQLEAYSDSDYAGSHGDRKSTTGRCQFLGRRLISWQCKKQTIVATSSTEAD